MKQEYRMNGFTNLIVSSERKGHIAYSTACFGMFQVFLDPAYRINKVNRIIIVFLHSSADDQNIRIENDILRRKINFVDQNIVGALTNFDTSFKRIGLAFFVESHHNYCGSISFQQLGLFPKNGLAFLHADGIHNRFALNTFQSLSLIHISEPTRLGMISY